MGRSPMPHWKGSQLDQYIRWLRWGGRSSGPAGPDQRSGPPEIEGDRTVKALRTSGERQVDVLALPIPKPEPGEVVIQMRATGICGSDLHPYRRPSALHL